MIYRRESTGILVIDCMPVPCTQHPMQLVGLPRIVYIYSRLTITNGNRRWKQSCHSGVPRWRSLIENGLSPWLKNILFWCRCQLQNTSIDGFALWIRVPRHTAQDRCQTNIYENATVPETGESFLPPASDKAFAIARRSNRARWPFSSGCHWPPQLQYGGKAAVLFAYRVQDLGDP